MKQIPHTRIPGVALAVSGFVLGCDNKDTAEEGAPVWDHWFDKGGTAFDTAHIYGGGKHETALGGWISQRGVGKSVVVICKGAHTPHCTPEAIGQQLTVSLERLRLDHAPIYIMHRDNPEVPVSEFVDAINTLQRKGFIGIYGGSNWSVPRLRAAQEYALKRGTAGPSVLNNNLSLATMVRPVWPGCVSANNPADLAFLRQSNTVHFSWSSQARGYFLPDALRHRLPEDTAPETCFGSSDNHERRKRAEILAAEKGVQAHTIAAAWVLNQSFPSFALIGPRNIAEIDSSMPGAHVALSASEVAWLNLEASVRV